MDIYKNFKGETGLGITEKEIIVSEAVKNEYPTADETQLLGLRIQFIRKYLGITREELSDVTGISATHLADIENGRTNASFRKIKSIAKAMKIPVTFLCIDETGDERLTELLKIHLLPEWITPEGSNERGIYDRLLHEGGSWGKCDRILGLVKNMEEDEMDIVYYGLLMLKGIKRMTGSRKHG